MMMLLSLSFIDSLHTIVIKEGLRTNLIIMMSRLMMLMRSGNEGGKVGVKNTKRGGGIVEKKS